MDNMEAWFSLSIHGSKSFHAVTYCTLIKSAVSFDLFIVPGAMFSKFTDVVVDDPLRGSC
jgi:hypothetical protein